LIACPYGLAQALLDSTAGLLSPALASAVAAVRGAPTGSPACRPAMAGGMSSLDADLEALLTTPGAPAPHLSSIGKDLAPGALAAGAGSAGLRPRFPTRRAGPRPRPADHALGMLRTGLPSPAPGYDTSTFGLPVVEVKDVPVSYDAGKLTIGAHGFTLGLPA